MDAIVLSPKAEIDARPILKWAGGKTQLLDKLLNRVPQRYGRYIEPFFGGGALFFAVKPRKALISDSNPELCNLYVQVANDPEPVISWLESWDATREVFYRVRALRWDALLPAEAAARTIYLNKTCFNGLYRVNKRGEFNVPFGRYKNPKVVDRNRIYAASERLRTASIECLDFRKALKAARKGDFVFLDPPYVPVSKNADFKRYTKDQFRENDHVDLAQEAHRLVSLGCTVVVTNSDHPLVRKLYADFAVETCRTNRSISSDRNTRAGTDLIFTSAVAQPATAKHRPTAIELRTALPSDYSALSSQVGKFPPTRFMGSKSRLLEPIFQAASQLEFETFVDLFSGSGVVSYMFKAAGKRVVSNDHMHMAFVAAQAMLENNGHRLTLESAKQLLVPGERVDDLVRKTFGGIYFSRSDEFLIDVLRTNIHRMADDNTKSIALSALIRACIKKRARGIFTYVGPRYDDGRRDLRLNLAEHFLEAVDAINGAVFDNGRRNQALNMDALDVKIPSRSLVYLDPPYFSPLSDNDYVRRYHFVEGLARDWRGISIQQHTKTKKFSAYETPFRTEAGTEAALDAILVRSKKNPVVLSYSSNGLPTRAKILALLRRHKSSVEMVPVPHKYSFGNHSHKVGSSRNSVDEYLFVAW